VPDFLLPDLGEGLTEAEIISWHVKVGDHVDVDQAIVEVETAKAAVEVPVPFAGAVTKIHAASGAVVAVGQPLITVTADEPALWREPGTVTPALAEASGNVLIGYGTAVTPRRDRRATRQSPPRAPEPRQEPAPEQELAPAAASKAAALRRGPVPVISPLVRKIARDAGLDLAGVTGTGPDGLVRRDDVRRALAERDTATPATPVPAATAVLATTAVPAVAGTAGRSERRIPLRGSRRIAAEKLTRSRREIPEATVWVDVDATGLVES
jgi:2-oxoisovalerate dehydrogenase E2 component (dihydrolipoyl transacylase)